MVSFKEYSKFKSTVRCTVTLTTEYHDGNSWKPEERPGAKEKGSSSNQLATHEMMNACKTANANYKQFRDSDNDQKWRISIY